MRLLCLRKGVYNYALKRLLFCLLLFSALPVFAQTVTGTVKDTSGVPLPNVSVSVKGHRTTTMTAADGTFLIKAAKKDVLQFTSVGYGSQSVEVGNQVAIVVSLRPAINSLNDVVVVGYGSVRKKDLTGSVAIVNVADAKKTATYDMAKMLQGQAAGVSVQGSGEPGGYVAIKIRGISTFGSNSPLFVIDGVPVDAPYDFSPDDIESMQILKDASAAAIYGSRAATGVVIITTKKGRGGVARVNFSSYIGLQQIPKKLHLTDREQYQKIVYASEENAGIAHTAGNDPSNPAYIDNINTDWQKEGLKTGLIQNHNVGVLGGNEFLSYNVSLGYFDQTGYQVGPQKYDRYTFNSGLQGKKGKLSFGAKAAYTQSRKGDYGVTNGHAVYGGTVTSLVTAIPTVPVYDSSRKGGYGGPNDAINGKVVSTNVVGINNLINQYHDRNRILLNAWAELELVKNLRYKLNLSYDRTDFKDFHYEPTFDMGYYYVNDQYFMSQAMGQSHTGLIENTLTYQLQKNKHKLDLLGGMTYQQDHYESMTATAQDDGDLEFQTFDAVSNTNAKTIVGTKNSSTLFSLLGRVNYNYDDRYLLTANFRRDGSSRFSPYHRYGNFSGFAAAWNIGNEHFFSLPKSISSLKLRAGYGTLGNQSSLGNYAWQSYIVNSANYVFGNTLATGSSTVSVSDASLKWESTTTSNVAIDLGMLNERLTFTLEYFNRKSKDIITSIPIAYSVGSYPATLTTNAATMKNYGFEFTVNYKKNQGDFTYNISANAYTLKNKVLKLGGSKDNPIYGSGSKTAVGREVGELYGYKTEGLFQTQEEVSSHAFQSTQTAPGDVKFKAHGDKDSDPTYTLSDDSDRVYLGSSIPKFYYGLNFDASYKNFDFSFFFQGNAGNKVFNAVYQSLMSGQYSNAHTDELNYWTPTNTKTNVPRPMYLDPNGNSRFSDRFVESGSYLKLQNLQIGYNVPSKALHNNHVIKSLRVYLSGQNLVTISGYKGYDPDFISDGLFSRGYDYGSFPNPRSYMFGVQLGL